MLLVTGATGFLGTQLVIQLLQTEAKIRCIKRYHSVMPPQLKNLNHKIEWLNADVLNVSDLETAFAGITKVYHCAAIISFNAKNNPLMIRTNAEGTANVVNLCKMHNVQKLIHVSSIAALGKSKNGELVTEQHYWDAFDINNGYAVSKYQSEMEVWRGIEEGLNAVIVNPSIILGTDASDAGTGTMFKAIQNGLKYYTEGSSGLVNVTDVAKVMIFLGNSTITAQRFIINTQNLSYKKMFENIAYALGVPAPTKKASPFMLGIAWRLSAVKAYFTGKNNSLTAAIVAAATTQQAFSNQKICRVIDFDFKPINTSLSEIAEKLKKQGNWAK
jgi:dihydroflavonol-4-reductase